MALSSQKAMECKRGPFWKEKQDANNDALWPMALNLMRFLYILNNEIDKKCLILRRQDRKDGKEHNENRERGHTAKGAV